MSQCSSRRARLASLICLGLAVAGCATSPAEVGGPLRSPLRPFAGAPVGPIGTVVVDAGHGGHDPGASYYGLREKALTLDIARRLRGTLEAAGLTVVMTRETDQFIPLSGRPAVANRLQAGLFVSVHVNANRNARVSGVEVYYPRESVVASSAQWPPWVRHADIASPTLTVKQILWDLVLGRTRSQSRRLGSHICRSLRERLQVPCRGVKSARFVVLREAWMPAVLVEVGYVSNLAEARRLGTAEYRQAAADAVANGIISYVRELGVQHI